MDIFTIVFGLVLLVIILIKPILGLFITIMLIPQTSFQAISGTILNIFTGATPIKIIGGMTFLSVLIRYIHIKNKEKLFQIPQFKFFILFLIYIYISGFAMPGFATKENFTAFTSFAILGFILLVLVNNLRIFRLIVWWAIIPVFIICLSSILNYSGIDTRGQLIRMSGASYDANYFAIFLLPFLGLSFGCLFAEKNKILKLLALIIVCIIAFALLLTFSRGGLVGLLIILLISFLKAKNKILVFLILALAIILSIIFMPPHVRENIKLRVNETELAVKNIEFTSSVDSTKRRYMLAKAAWEIFLNNPLFGIGIGNYYYDLRKYVPISAGRAHNMYLEILAEMGLVGFLLFISIFWQTLRSLLKMMRLTQPINYYAYGIYIGLMGFLTSAMFLHAQHERGLWFIVFMSALLSKISQKEQLLIKNKLELKN